MTDRFPPSSSPGDVINRVTYEQSLQRVGETAGQSPTVSDPFPPSSSLTDRLNHGHSHTAWAQASHLLQQGATAGWNLLYTNTNPNPDTICTDCRAFIGQIFHPDNAPPLPMHHHCYCLYEPVQEPPTWPKDDAPWETWGEYFQTLQDTNPAKYRRWVQRAAWYLRIGWPLGIMAPLEAAARRYNQDEYKPKDPEEESMPNPDTQGPQNSPGQQNRGNHPSPPPNHAQNGSPGRVSIPAGHIFLEALSPDWRTYEAILVQPGWIKQDDGQDSNWLIPAQVLQDAVNRGLFQALPHYVDHPELFGFGWHQSPSVRDLAGIATNPRWDPEIPGVVATIRLYGTEAGQLLGTLYDHIIADAEAGRDVPPLGLSIAAFREYEYNEDDGTRVWTNIKKVSSVDAVYEPGAAGYIRQALSAAASPMQSDHSPLQNPDAFPGQEIQPNLRQASAPDVGQVSIPAAAANPQGEQTMTEETRTPETNLPEEEVIQAAVSTVDNNAPATAVDTPPENPPVQEGQPLNRIEQNMATLNAAVARLERLLAAQEENNTIQSMGEPPRGPALYGGLQGIDQVKLAVEALISGTRPPDGVRPLTGIRELYMLLSGDYELTGRFHDDRVYLANVTTSTMANIVADSLNKVVVNMFQQYDQWWAPAVTVRDFSNLQDVKWITLGGVGELPTVAEGAAYTELTWDDQKETDAFVKKGGYLGITIETIDKDDTGRVMAAPRALAQGAWLTLGKAIAAIFTDNGGYGPTMSDSNYLIDSSNHSNEGSTALSYAAWQATIIAMMKATELNSGERLGALTRPRYIWVPIDLEATAVEILAAGEGEPDDADYHVNPDALADGLTARTAAARRRVITVPFWTDTNDWVAQADPNLYPSIGLGFRYGRTPEIFSVADPRAGLMFTNDTMPIKVRFFYAVGPTDWRGVYKHIVS